MQPENQVHYRHRLSTHNCCYVMICIAMWVKKLCKVKSKLSLGLIIIQQNTGCICSLFYIQNSFICVPLDCLGLPTLFSTRNKISFPYKNILDKSSSPCLSIRNQEIPGRTFCNFLLDSMIVYQSFDLWS